METLAVRPLLPFWAAWLALVLAYDHRRGFSIAAVGLATTLIVGIVRYFVLVFAYLEHDQILTEAGRGLAAPALALGLSGFGLGVAAADVLHRSTYALPAPNAPTPEAAFLWDGGACAFPPVLGSPESLPAERSFDTLLVSVQRLGLVPRVAHEYDGLIGPDTRVAFVVAPVRPPPGRVLDQLKSFVQAGGALVVVDDMGIGRDGSAGDFLRPFEITLEYHGSGEGSSQSPPHVHLGGGMKPLAVPDSMTVLASALRGRGRVVYLSDARSFSRRGLGHCFAHPWKEARERYEMIYVLLRDVLALAPLDRRYYGIL